MESRDGNGSYAFASIFSTLVLVAGVCLPSTSLALSRISFNPARAACAAANDFFSSPYFLSEKYLVKTAPLRLMERRQP